MHQRVVCSGGNSLRTMRAVLAVGSWLGAGIAVLSAQPVQAQMGYGCLSTGNGVQMRVDMSWVEGCGYRPVFVDVQAMGNPAPAERYFSVRLRSRHRFMRPSPTVTVVEHFVMPAGSNHASVVLTMPWFFGNNEFDVELYEDGELLDKVSQREVYVSIPNTAWDSSRPRVLFVTGDSTWPALGILIMQGRVDTRRRFAVQPPAPGTAPSAALLAPPPEVDLDAIVPGMRNGLQLNQAAVAKLAALPERWQQYLALDIVCISLDDLLLLARSHPRRLEALVGWAHAGGTVMVGGLSPDYARLGELERVLGLARRAKVAGDFRARGWSAPDPTRWRMPNVYELGQGVERSVPMASSGMPMGAAGTLPQRRMMGSTAAGAMVSPDLTLEMQPEDLATASQRPGPEAKPFLVRPYGLGRVIALGNEGRPSVSVSDWGWLLGTLEMRALWGHRHGVDLLGGNASFWQFLIPGVGLAPRWTFLLLISLFVVVIGPVNYYWLKRRQKLYLLPVLVPSVAALVTLGLFAYAVVGDGLGVRVRVRSWTEIDQRAGRATSWSRLS